MATKSLRNILCVAVAALMLPVGAQAETIGDPSVRVTGHLYVGANYFATNGKKAFFTNGQVRMADLSGNVLWISSDGFHFDRLGAAYVDNHRVGSATIFRVSFASPRDTTAMTISANGVVTMGANNVRITNGDLTVSGMGTVQVLEITGGADLSENFKIAGNGGQAIEPGMVVIIDPTSPGGLTVSGTAYDKKVAGIVSGAGGLRTGMTMGQAGSIASGDHPVALTGRVFCKANDFNGVIQPGDLLTTSNIPGHAMKVTDHSRAQGAILGKAMTPVDPGTGLVLVLVSLQ